jgi:hypothetical protein
VIGCWLRLIGLLLNHKKLVKQYLPHGQLIVKPFVIFLLTLLIQQILFGLPNHK